MPKKETKKGSQAALRQQHTSPFSAPESPPTAPADNDPPIIVSGGSVTITSKVFLSVNYDEQRKRYIYYTDAVKVKKIMTTGQRNEQDVPRPDGTFVIDLLDQ